MELSQFVQQCHSVLLGDEGITARHYLLNERGLAASTIERLQLGFCGGSQELPGSSPELQKKNWLMKNRVTVPIGGEFGEIVGCAARVPNPKENGWWNTSFDKGHHIFLFDRARKAIFDADKVYVFEGYMDTMILHQEGLLNSVGLMGTALGYRRIGLLKRYCNRVCLCFDSDANKSGQEARDRSVFEVSRFKFDDISEISMPLEVDPDDYVLQHGLEEFLRLERRMAAGEIQAIARRYTRSLQGEVTE